MKQKIKSIEEICKGEIFKHKDLISEITYCNLRFNDDRLQTPNCRYRSKTLYKNNLYGCLYSIFEYLKNIKNDK